MSHVGKWIGLATFLALGGCAAPPPAIPQTITLTKTIFVPWSMPESLKHCAADPSPIRVPAIIPADPHGGSKVATYIDNLRAHDRAALAAADDCRNVLAAVVQASAPGPTKAKP